MKQGYDAYATAQWQLLLIRYLWAALLVAAAAWIEPAMATGDIVQEEPSFWMRNLWTLLAIYILLGAIFSHVENDHMTAALIYTMLLVGLLGYVAYDALRN